MDIGLLVPIIGVSIPVIALLRSPLRHWLQFKERQLDQQASLTAERAAQYAAKTAQLESRVAVLERIITDRATHLGEEIERLRDRPVH